MGIVDRVASRWLRIAHPPMTYREGDIIEARTLSGKIRRVLVQAKESDIKDGQPGWDGLIITSDDRNDERGESAWGYDSNVLRRVGRAPAGLERSLEKGEPPPGAGPPSAVPNMYDAELEKKLDRLRR